MLFGSGDDVGVHSSQIVEKERSTSNWGAGVDDADDLIGTVGCSMLPDVNAVDVTN